MNTGIITQYSNNLLAGETKLSANLDIIRIDLQPSEQYKSVSTVKPAFRGHQREDVKLAAKDKQVLP